MAEEEVRKLEKKFKQGSHVRVRVLGFRHLEGLATGILKVKLLYLTLIPVMDTYLIFHLAVYYIVDGELQKSFSINEPFYCVLEWSFTKRL